MAKKKSVTKKGKKDRKAKITPKINKKFKKSGDKVDRSKTCPRCGKGVFLAEHKDRLHCGKCSYTEFLKK